MATMEIKPLDFVCYQVDAKLITMPKTVQGYVLVSVMELLLILTTKYALMCVLTIISQTLQLVYVQMFVQTTQPFL